MYTTSKVLIGFNVFKILHFMSKVILFSLFFLSAYELNKKLFLTINSFFLLLLFCIVH